MNHDNTIRPEFRAFLLNQKGAAALELTRLTFTELLNRLESVCPAGRELAIVKTKLEEACAFAIRSIASSVDYRAELQPSSEKAFEKIIDDYDLEHTKARKALTVAGIPEGGSLTERIEKLAQRTANSPA